MMASQQTKLHDPMYNFDTHFPERLSRLHLHSEVPGSFRKKRSRAERNSARYKTQPVTFDEIKEVDEEPVPDEKLKPENLMGQLQAFSRSMDGLIPKGVLEGQGHFHPHGSHSRSGSRKFHHRHPDCIPEKAEAEQQLQQQQQQQQQKELGQNKPCHTSTDRLLPSQPQNSQESKNLSVEATTDSAPSSPVSPKSPQAGVSDVMANMAPRRQKVTAKAKKRQKASEEGQSN